MIRVIQQSQLLQTADSHLTVLFIRYNVMGVGGKPVDLLLNFLVIETLHELVAAFISDLIEVVDDVSGLASGIQSSNSLIVFICPYHNVILLNKSLQILCRSPLVKVGHDGQLLHRYALMFIDEEQENHLAGTYSVLGQVTVKILLRVAIQDRNVYKKIILITH